MSGNEHSAPATIEQLEERLHRGWKLIEQAEDDQQAARYTQHWLALLDEYERACGGSSAPEQESPDADPE